MSESQTAVEPFEQAFRSASKAGNWRAAVDARVNSAIWAFQNGRRMQSEQFFEEAINLAQMHGLPVRALELGIQRLDLRMTGDPAGATLDELKREIPRMINGMVKLLMAASHTAIALDDSTTAGELLSQAAVFAQALSPENRCSVEMELADYHEAQAGRAESRNDSEQVEAEFTKALAHAEQALRSARISGGVDALAPPLVKVAVLRAHFPDDLHQKRSDEAIAELERGGWRSDFIHALILRSQSTLTLGRIGAARADIDRALAVAPNRELRGLALKMMALIRYEAEDLDGGRKAIGEAIQLLEQEEAEDGQPDETTLGRRFKEIELLYLFSSWFAAKSGDPVEAFHSSESGRAVKLRHELALAGGDASISPILKFQQVRSMLADYSAALLTLSVTRWGTLAILVDPQHLEPRVFFLALSGSDLKSMLTPKSGADEKAGTQALLDSLPGLSEKLLPGLEMALREVAPTCEAFYVVPDSSLFHVPFSALALSDRSHLIEHLPVAVIPSASILSDLLARRPLAQRHVCMAYGMGECCDIFFREQADQVAQLAWEQCTVFPERTSKLDLLNAMSRYPVIHFACHGSLSAGISDPLAASQIELFPPEVLTAGDVLNSGGVPAELVFLNACQSGRFRADARNEPDGFWRAFLYAGARTFIATLALINPEAASSLALDFYANWLAGNSKVKALQQAQCAMIERSAPVEHWALHVLVGDAE